MKIFLDTANIDEIRHAKAMGILDGVTTNPSLVKREIERLGGDCSHEELAKRLDDILVAVGYPRPVNLEVIGNTTKAMVEEGLRLYRKFHNPDGGSATTRALVIKVPINPATETEDPIGAGLETIAALKAKGIPVNVTLIMTPEQALLAAKAGASYVSPFAGRIDDLLVERIGAACRTPDWEYLGISGGEKTRHYPAGGVEVRGRLIEDNGIVSGVDLVAKTVQILRSYPDLKTEVLAASIRTAWQARECAEVGAHIATVPYKVLLDMLRHPKTTDGMRKFTQDTLLQYREVIYGKR